MARKSSSKKRTGGSPKNQAQKSPWLALTLVPLVMGALMVILWALDIFLWDPADTQVTIGVLFILISFASSNAVQKRWYPAAGWSLIAVADLLILTRLVLWIQIVAFVIGGIGLVLIGIEFYQRWKERTSK